MISTTSSSPRHRAPERRGPRRAAAAAIVAGLVLTGTGSAVVNAAVPPFEVGNLVLFPNRDFITVEGYQAHINQMATVTVTRDGAVIGSAKHLVEAGDVAFEINHPGGACWGDGTGLKVTPDIRPGDKATISFDGEANAGDTTVADAYATEIHYVDGDKNFTVTGHIDNVIKEQSEQRIVNPALRDTTINRRDIRAVPGGLTPAAKGGYSSDLVFGDGDKTFTAIYQFDDADVARIAATGGGTRFMNWQEEDADANRQGLTIAEMEESGGPGMGGCPAGPTEQNAPQPGFAFAVRSANKTSLKVNWEPAIPQPGTAAVTGYSVEAIGATTNSTTGQQDAVGARVLANSKGATLSGLKADESYTVEVRSLTGKKLSEPFVVQTPPAPDGDTVAPIVTATPAPDLDPTQVVTATSVTLVSSEAGEIYYTTDGTPAVDDGDLPSDNAKLYTGPIPITAQTKLHWIGIDLAGNTDVTKAFGTYAPPTSTVPAPAALAAPTGTVGQESVTLKWVSTDTSITGYSVQRYKKDATGTTILDGSAIETADKTITIKPLTALTAYTFTVKAKNAGGGYGAESPQSLPLTPTAITDSVSIGTGKYKATDFRVTGSASQVGATITLYTVLSNGSIGVPLAATATTTVVAAAPPAVGGTWEVRLRNNVPANPGRIFAKSSGGGVAGPFTLS